MVCFPGIWAPYTLSIFTMVSSIIIAIVTIIGNVLIITVIFKNPLKNLHTPFNYFLTNLAVSDLIVGAVTMPIAAYVHYEESTGELDDILVKILHMSYFIAATASLLSLIVLSIDRYIAITWAIKYRQYLSWSRCIISSVFIWIFSLTVPFIYFEWGYINYLMFYANTAILIGLIVMVGVYIRVYLFLRNQTTEMKNHLRSSSTAANEFHLKRLIMEKKVTRTFLIILFMFVFTYVPAIIMIYILHFCETCDCQFRHVLRDLQFLLISANSCVNPFICAIRLKTFNKSIKQLFKKQHTSHESTVSKESGSSEMREEN